MSERFVYVPMVGERCAPMKLGVNAHGEPSATGDFTTCGPRVFKLGKAKQKEVEGVVKKARHRERKPDKKLEMVSVEFYEQGDALVDGESYGLALAIADRLARYPESAKPNWLRPASPGVANGQGRIVATGCLHADERHVEVLPVGGFPAKLRCLRSWLDDGTLRAGDLFLYPRQNADALDRADRELLRDMNDRGLACRALDRLDWSDEPVGTGRCRDDRRCVGKAIALALAAILAVVIGFLWRTDLPPPPQGPALAFQYRYGGELGTNHALTSGDRLASGERFTLRLDARTDAYVYVWHFDAHQQVQELLGRARERQGIPAPDRNLVRAGEQIELPGPNGHYALDDHPGTEWFYVVVGSERQQGLEVEYQRLQKKMSRPGSPQARGGPEIVPDTDPLLDRLRGIHDSLSPSPTTAASRLLQCPPAIASCRQSFVIEHVAAPEFAR